MLLAEWLSSREVESGRLVQILSESFTFIFTFGKNMYACNLAAKNGLDSRKGMAGSPYIAAILGVVLACILIGVEGHSKQYQ